MPPTAQLLKSIDARLDPLWPGIQGKQLAYLQSHQRFFQGLSTHSRPPTDGADVKADRINLRPRYQAEGWDAMGLPKVAGAVSLPCCLRCDQYRGPAGSGYVLTMTVVVNGETWTRIKQQGPETFREKAWLLKPTGNVTVHP